MGELPRRKHLIVADYELAQLTAARAIQAKRWARNRTMIDQPDCELCFLRCPSFISAPHLGRHRPWTVSPIRLPERQSFAQ